MVVIFGGAGRSIVMERAWVSDWFRVSVACTVKSNFPATDGVPVIWPVEGLMGFRPVGNEPALILQVRAPVPPRPAQFGCSLTLLSRWEAATWS